MLIDTCPTLESKDEGLIFQAGLAIPSLNGYIPRHKIFATKHPIWTDFDSWWNGSVIRTKDRTYSRKELVLLLANKEGGAHIDPKLTEHYEKLKKEGSGFYIAKGNEDPKPMTNEEHACLRQIAYELLESVEAIKKNQAPKDNLDRRPIAFMYPVYLFIKADDKSPLDKVKIATIEVLDNLLPIFDSNYDLNEAKKALVGDYEPKSFGKKGLNLLLKKVIAPRGIKYFTLNPDLTNEELRTIPKFSISELIKSTEKDISDEEILKMINGNKARKI